MKRIVLTIIALTTIVFANTQSASAFQKSNSYLDIGFMTSWEEGMGASVQWSTGIGNMFSIGAGLNYSANEYLHWGYGTWWLYSEKVKHRFLTPSARLSFHILAIPRLTNPLDLYVSFRAGPRFNFWSYEDDSPFKGNDTSDVDFLFDFMLGARWHFSQKVYLWAEIGIDNGTLGLGFRF